MRFLSTQRHPQNGESVTQASKTVARALKTSHASRDTIKQTPAKKTAIPPCSAAASKAHRDFTTVGGKKFPSTWRGGGGRPVPHPKLWPFHQAMPMRPQANCGTHCHRKLVVACIWPSVSGPDLHNPPDYRTWIVIHH